MTIDDGRYEAEDPTLSGGAGINNDHTGYSGIGFVDGYVTQGASTTFDAPSRHRAAMM